MTRDDLERRVREVVSDALLLPDEDVGPEKSLVGDLGADSLDTSTIALAIEDEFGVTVNDEDSWETVGDIIDEVRRLTADLQ